MATKRKRGTRRRRPGWTEEKGKEAEAKYATGITTKKQTKKEDSQILKTEKTEVKTPEPLKVPKEQPALVPDVQHTEEVVKPQKKEANPQPALLGTERNPIKISRDSDFTEAFLIFFQTRNRDDLFFKSETTIQKNGLPIRIIRCEGPKGKTVDLYFDISALSAFG